MRYTTLRTSPAAGCLHNGNAEGLGEGGIQEDVSLHEHSPHLRVLQCPQQLHLVLQVVTLTHFLQENMLRTTTTWGVWQGRCIALELLT